MADQHGYRGVSTTPKTDGDTTALPGASNPLDAITQRFLSLCPLDDSAPATRWKDFKHPLLRRFTKHDEKINWRRKEGAGRDGFVFKAYFGKEGPFAIKIFMVNSPHPQHPWAWQFRAEAKTVAMIEKIRWVIDHSEGPFLVNDFPETQQDMLRSLWLFSDEGRASNADLKDPVPMSADCQVTRCYGWIKINWKDMPFGYGWNRQDYYAIVYEYVPATEVIDLDITTSNVRFFQHAGFVLDVKKLDNWRQGKLVDFGDICSPFFYRDPPKFLDIPFPSRRPRDMSKFYPLGTRLKHLEPGNKDLNVRNFS